MSNKALIAIVGPSGSGKSTSIRNLPAETTRILDLERKGFPFRDISKFKVLPCNNMADIDKNIAECLADKTVTHIVIESFQKYIEMLMRSMQNAFKGYDIFTQYNKNIGMFLDKVKNDHAVVIMTALDEIVTIMESDGSMSSRCRMAVKGKEWEGKVEKEFLLVFFTMARKNKDGRMEYFFQTNTDGVTSSKTPMDMFDTQYIPNDLNAAIEQAKKYFNGSEPTK